jgi:uncharacterized protein YndB with AHSA1/START domain
MPKTDTADREIVQERLLDAPREKVWRAWTEPDHLKVWWGPNGFTNTIHSYELKVGGVWDFMMHGPDGTDYPNRIVYEEIKKPERLVYTHGESEKDAHFFRSTVTFEDVGGKTKLTMRAVFNTREDYDAVKGFAVEGGRQTLGRLAEHLKIM